MGWIQMRQTVSFVKTGYSLCKSIKNKAQAELALSLPIVVRSSKSTVFASPLRRFAIDQKSFCLF